MRDTVLEAYVEDARRFAAQHPDFVRLYNAFLRRRDARLIVDGVADTKRRDAMITADERRIVVDALQAKASPAARIYEIAKAETAAERI